MTAVRLRSSLLLTCVVLIAVVAGAQATEPERYTKTFPLSSGGALSVRNDRGRISVEGWDKKEVVVDVYKHFEGENVGVGPDRESWMRQATVEFDASASRVDVRVHRPENFCIGYCNYRGWIDLTIHAPRSLRLDIVQDRAPVEVSAIEGSVTVRTDRAPVRLERITGGVRVHSDRSPIVLRDIKATQPVEIENDRADIELENVTFGGGGSLSTDRASIRARLPESTALTLDVQRDRRSSFHSDFPIATSGNVLGDGALRGSINGGGPTLRLRTDRGTIHLERWRASM
jgi:hypothetical protein